MKPIDILALKKKIVRRNYENILIVVSVLLIALYYYKVESRGYCILGAK
jgi:hypothetical protein